MLVAELLLFAEADGAKAVGRNTKRHEILLGGAGSAIAEREIVFGGAALIAMALDGGTSLRMIAEELRSLRKGGTRVSPNVSFIEVEVSVLDFLREQFRPVRFGSWRWRRSRRAHSDPCRGRR